MISIYIAYPLAGVTWVVFLGERVVEAGAVLLGLRPGARPAPPAPPPPTP